MTTSTEHHDTERARAIAALRAAAALVYNRPTCQLRIRRLGWALAQLEALDSQPQETSSR